MDAVLYDLRLALRGLVRSPLASGLAVVCLALGIGANAAMFSVVHGLILTPLPFTDADRLVTVQATNAAAGVQRAGTAYPDLVDYQAQSRAFAPIVGVSNRSLTFSDTDEPERVRGAAVSWPLFSMLGITPVLGRDFSADDDRAGAAPVLLLSDELWRRRYNADPAVVGRALLVNGQMRTVIGVLPPRVKFPALEVAWIPLAPVSQSATREDRTIDVFARIAPGRTRRDATVELADIARRLGAAYRHDDSWSIRVDPLRDFFMPAEPRLATLAAMGAVTLVLLIACANVANLLLARATTRAREMSVRAAIGAGRARVVRQLLTESVLLGLASAPLGVALAWVGILALRAGVPVNDVPYLIDFQLDPATVAYTIAISAATGLVFGLAPAIHASKGDLLTGLREGGRTGEGGARNRARNALVMAEVAVALVLLVGAALFVRSFLNLQRADTGFDTAPVTTARFYMPGDAYTAVDAKTRRVNDVLRRLQGMPGVRAAAASNLIPLDGGGDIGTIEVAARTYEPGKEPRLFYAGVTAQYFDVLGIPTLRGRAFTAQEAETRSAVAVINVSMARRFFGPADEPALPRLADDKLAGAAALGAIDPVGRRFRLRELPDAPWFTVIGVVPDVMIERLGYGEVTPAAFVPYPYQETPNTGVMVRADGDPSALTARIREAIRGADPTMPMFAASSMDEIRRQGFWQFALFGQMFGTFGALALVLAVVGVYGVLSYSVSQRTQEFGVRMALGAEPADVRRMMIGQGVRLAAWGIAFGVVGAAVATRLISSLLYNVTASDPASFVAVVSLMLGVAAAAAYLPARRATRVDPMTALRAD
ncbi:MAG: ABC transporter permease [Vicinamibacterales bacterium]